MTIGELLKNYEENDNIEIWVHNCHGFITHDDPLTKENIYNKDWEDCYVKSWEIYDGEDRDKVRLYIESDD